MESYIRDLDLLKKLILTLKNVKGALGRNGPTVRIIAASIRIAADQLNGIARTVNGALYELEVAYKKLMDGETLEEFGIIYDNLKSHFNLESYYTVLNEIKDAVEFDVVTKTKLIECKNIISDPFISI